MAKFRIVTSMAFLYGLICTWYLSLIVLSGANKEKKRALECLEAVYEYRYSFCDRLRDVIDQNEWETMASETIHTDFYGDSPAFNAIWDGRDDFVDEFTGIIPTLLNLVFEPFYACINHYGSNYKIINFENGEPILDSFGNQVRTLNNKDVIVKIPNYRSNRVNGTDVPPFLPPSIPRTPKVLQLIEYVVEINICRKEDGKMKLFFTNETQSFQRIDEAQF